MIINLKNIHFKMRIYPRTGSLEVNKSQISMLGWGDGRVDGRVGMREL